MLTILRTPIWSLSVLSLWEAIPAQTPTKLTHTKTRPIEEPLLFMFKAFPVNYRILYAIAFSVAGRLPRILYLFH